MTDVLATPMAQALGLALVHFVWQGAAIGLATALLLLVASRASANTRYLIAAIGLMGLAAAPVVTTVVAVRSAQNAEAVLTLPDGRQLLLGGNPVILADTIEVTSPPARLAGLEAWLPWVVLTWSAGVLLLTIRLARGWLDVLRIRRRAVGAVPPAVRTMLERVAIELGVTRHLRVAESSMVEVPTVIGWVWPLVLLPASALAGLSPSQMEAIIAHEVAHIRRHDYLINSIQNLVETVLFYHPAVWWVSKQMRIEREHCCDDLAVSTCADRVTYARALATLEESRQKTLALGVAATGGDLLSRVQRVLGASSETRQQPSIALAICVVAGLALSGLVARASSVGPVALLPSPPALTAEVGGNAAFGDHRQRFVDTQGNLAADGGARARTDDPTERVGQTGQKPADNLNEGLPNPSLVFDLDRQFRDAIVGKDVVALRKLLSEEFAQSDPSGNWSLRDQVLQEIPSSSVRSVEFELTRIHFQAPGTAIFAGRQLENTGGSAKSFVVTRVWMLEHDRRWRLMSSSRFLASEAAPGTDRRLSETTIVGGGATGDVIAATPPLPPPPPPPPPASGARRDGPIRVGGNVQEPIKIRDVKPIYPQEARDAGIQGIVILAATLDESGAVVDARVLRGVASVLDDAAVGAVRQWRYTPTIIDGVPASAMITVTINFQLN